MTCKLDLNDMNRVGIELLKTVTPSLGEKIKTGTELTDTEIYAIARNVNIITEKDGSVTVRPTMVTRASIKKIPDQSKLNFIKDICASLKSKPATPATQAVNKEEVSGNAFSDSSQIIPSESLGLHSETSPIEESEKLSTTQQEATSVITEQKPITIHETNLLHTQEESMDCLPGSLIETAPNTLVACWYGGNGTGQCSVDMQETGIWVSIYKNQKWDKPFMAHFEKSNKCWNPVLLNAGGDHLVLFFKIGKDPRQWVPVMKHSYDQGQTWTDTEVLPAGIFGPTKNAPYVEKNLWICPSSFSRGEPTQTWKSTACWLDVTTDQGKTWCKYGPITLPGQPFGITEPCMFKNEDGKFTLFFRNRGNKIGLKGPIYSTTFCNDSKTFSPITPTTLPNPDSGIDCTKLKDGKVLLIHNDSYTDRFPLAISVSKDEGRSWTNKIILENLPGEYSQPSIVQSHDGKIHAIYSYSTSGSRRNIKHVCLKQPDSNETL